MQPADAEHLARALRQFYADAEETILVELARAVERSASAIDQMTTRLETQRRMLNAVDGILDTLDSDLPGAVQDLVDLAHNRGLSVASGAAAEAGIEGALGGGIADTGTNVQLARAATNNMQGMRMQIRRWTNDTFAQAGLSAAGNIASGAVNRRDASRRMLTRLARQGITGFKDRSGRNWEMGAYAEMVGRTTVAQAQLEAQAQRLQELDIDTVIISDAAEECNLCRPWEGQVLSLSGSTAGRLSDGTFVMGTLDEARGQGLFHPNCGHSHSIYLPGYTRGPKKDTADPEGDQLRQRQRSYERRIREIKREKAIAEQFGEDEARAANRKLREKQSEFKAFRDEHNRTAKTNRTNIHSR